MTIPTLVEPIPGGFRACTSISPLLAADGPTAADALTALQALVAAQSAGRDRVAGVPSPDGADPFAAPIGDDPWFAEFLAACAENRTAQDDPALDPTG